MGLFGHSNKTKLDYQNLGIIGALIGNWGKIFTKEGRYGRIEDKISLKIQISRKGNRNRDPKFKFNFKFQWSESSTSDFPLSLVGGG